VEFKLLTYLLHEHMHVQVAQKTAPFSSISHLEATMLFLHDLPNADQFSSGGGAYPVGT